MFGNCTVKKSNQQGDSHENNTTPRNRDGDYRLVAQTTGNCSSQKHGDWRHVGSSVKEIPLALRFHHHHLENDVSSVDAGSGFCLRRCWSCLFWNDTESVWLTLFCFEDCVFNILNDVSVQSH